MLLLDNFSSAELISSYQKTAPFLRARMITKCFHEEALAVPVMMWSLSLAMELVLASWAFCFSLLQIEGRQLT